MTSLVVLGAEGSGVSILARALAHEEALPLLADIALAGERIAVGQRIVAFAPDVSPDCPQLARAPEILSRSARARAFVVWRQGVDFVNSWLRTRPDRHFIDHCRLWARSLEAAQRLQSLYPDRVALIEFRTLIDPSSAERVLAPGFKLTGAALAKFLDASAQGRTSFAPRRPVTDAARAAWAMGEVEAFARICGPAMRALGDEVDLAAAERRRPLDLARLFYERAYRIGRIDMAPSQVAGAPWTIAAADATATPQLRLTAIAAGERRRLRVRARSCTAGCVRFEAVEALTRRPLVVAPCLELGPTQQSLDVVLPPHDGTIEIALICSGFEPDPEWRLGLLDARLSHA